MPIEYRRLVRSRLDDAEQAEIARVDLLAGHLRERLELAAADIDLRHVHGAQSSAIQGLVSAILRHELAFSEEVVLTPQTGLVTRARPDFVYQLGPGRGVIAEVERGGTVTNNHDLKDMWKAHVVPDAHHLFLVVPRANWNLAGRAREQPFVRVCHRLSAFFGDARREVDVLSCHVFGYGRVSLG